jgi:hypothetical protein
MSRLTCASEPQAVALFLSQDVVVNSTGIKVYGEGEWKLVSMEKTFDLILFMQQRRNVSVMGRKW